MKDFLQTRQWVLDGSYAYFCTDLNSVFWKLDMKTGVATVLSDFKSVKKNNFCFYLRYGEDFYFFSDWGNVILKYNLRSGKSKNIKIESDTTLGIFNACIYKDMIYAISIRHGKIYKIDNELNILDEIILFEDDFHPSWLDSCIVESRIYVCGGERKELIIYDMETMCLLRKSVNIDDNVCSIGVSEKNFFIAGNKNDVVYRCIDSGEKIETVDEIRFSNMNRTNCLSSFRKILCGNNYFIVIPRLLSEVYGCFLGDDEKIVIKSLIDRKMQSNFVSEKIGGRYDFLYMNKEGVLGLIDKLEGMFVELNLKTGKSVIKKISFNVDDYKKFYSKNLFYKESIDTKLEDFLIFLDMEQNR